MVTQRQAPLVQTLLLDNYDSYTYNLYQMLSQVNGLEPVVYTNDAFGGDWDAAFAAFFKRVDQVQAVHRHADVVVNIVLSPGPGTPTKVEDFGLCAAAILRSPHVPILGVCLGHQGMAHLYGGKVERAPTVMHGRTSRIQQLSNTPDPFFFGIPRTFEVVRYHSLLATALPPATLDVLATTADDHLVMAFKHRELPHYGVQFHPESVCSEFGYQMLQNFRDITTGAPCQPCSLHHAPSASVDSPAMSTATSVSVEQLALSPSVETHQVLVEAVHGVTVGSEVVFEQLYGSSSHAFWLDSSNDARFSFMGDTSGPLAKYVAYDKWTNTVSTSDSVTTTTESILAFLRRELAAVRLNDRAPHLTSLPFDFRGGFVGYFGYEVLGVDRQSDLAVHPPPDMAVPDASFVFADRVVVYDAAARQFYLLVVTTPQHESESKDWMATTAARIRSLQPTPTTRSRESFASPIVFQPSRSRPTYEDNITTVLAEIQAGETYEVCLTNQLIATVNIADPLAFYKTLRRTNPAPFAAFLTTPAFAVCCSSPERFVSVDKHRHMESKPIKGTRKRVADAALDAAIAAELAACVKDRAENMMITDLVRNDFGHVCTVGSIHVPKLMQVESFATVHQLVTTVRGELRPSASVVDAIQATFPGGSMTGAPKKRTMELIRRVEQHPRGVYSGALGYLSINGAADLNIVIRTAVVTANHVTIGSGGAIVALSDTDDEYDEMLLKTQALRSALAAYTDQPVTVDVSSSFYGL